MIKLFNHSDIKWPFEGSPYINLDVKPYGVRIYVDPFPCYHHNLELVEKEVNYIENITKLPFPPSYFVLPFEGLCRTNGQASSNDSWDKDDKVIPNPVITLFGKRIPIMQSMTRYLIAHEYSHVVHYNLAYKINKKADQFSEIYAQNVRQIDTSKKPTSYGGLTWHNTIGEIIANDIRICLFNKEPEFWPHDAPYPDDTVKKYWVDINNEHFK